MLLRHLSGVGRRHSGNALHHTRKNPDPPLVANRGYALRRIRSSGSKLARDCRGCCAPCFERRVIVDAASNDRVEAGTCCLAALRDIAALGDEARRVEIEFPCPQAGRSLSEGAVV